MPTDPTACTIPWPELVERIPELADLGLQVELADPDDWRAYETWKLRLQSLIGWESPRYLDLPSDAYDVALRHLLEVWGG